MHPWMIYNSCLDERAEQMRAPCYESLVWCFLFLFVIVDGAEGRFCSPSFLLEHASVGKYGHFKARRRRNRNGRQLRGWEPGSSREVKTRKGARIHIRGGKRRRWCCNVIGERVRCPSRRTASMGHSGELYSSRPTFSPIPNVYFSSSSSKPPTFLLRLFDTSPLFTTSDHDVDWTTSPEVTQPSE